MKGLGQKLLVATMLGVVVLGALVLYGDVEALKHDLGAYAWIHFGFALGLAGANYAIRFVRWEAYLRALSIRIPRRDSALVFLSGFVMSITPGKIGEVWKSVLLADRYGVAVARSAPIVVAERLTDLVALILIASLGAYQFRVGWMVLITGIVLVGAVLAVVSSRVLTAWTCRLCARLPLVRTGAPKLAEALGSLQELVSARRLVGPTLLGAVAWAAECLAYYEVLRGFAGVRVEIQVASFVYAVSTVAGAVAMMPGGLGVTELGMTGLVQALSGPDVGPTIASAATILVRLATLWFAVLVGAGAYGLLRGSRQN